MSRFIDVAVALSLQADILIQFTIYCGTEDDAILNVIQNFYNVILDVLKANQISSSTGKPEIRFLVALMQGIGTDRNNGLDDDAKLYVEYETRSIGFRDKPNERIWLRFSASYALLKIITLNLVNSS